MTTEQFTNWYEELPILAYGEITDEQIHSAFKQILTWKQDGIFISDGGAYPIPESEHNFTVTEYWLYLGLLSRCIEYGSSPRGAWLTDFGIEVLEYLSNVSLSNCCGAPIVPETDICGQCGEHCDVIYG